MNIQRNKLGRSPFDEIVHIAENGMEWWSAREMVVLLGYSRYDNLEQAINRAKSACRNSGQDPSEHFLHSQEMVDIGSGGRRAKSDVHMTRFGCYLLAMNSDPDKFEVAAAQRYFAMMTRAAELETTTPVPIKLPARPWSERFQQTTESHFCYISIRHLGSFTVISETIAQVLIMEDELIRHLFPLESSDLPDGSIGNHWAVHRKKRGLSEPVHTAPLYLPDRGITVQVKVYSGSELLDFKIWFIQEYLPTHLPNYYLNKRQFRPHGMLPSASAADNTARKLTGKSASLPISTRKQLDREGGFIPVGRKPLPAPQNPQRKLFE